LWKDVEFFSELTISISFSVNDFKKCLKNLQMYAPKDVRQNEEIFLSIKLNVTK